MIMMIEMNLYQENLSLDLITLNTHYNFAYSMKNTIFNKVNSVEVEKTILRNVYVYVRIWILLQPLVQQFFMP